MPSRRGVVLQLFVAAIGTLVMIAVLVELKARLPLGRQQVAIANLVKAGAGVRFHDGGNGPPFVTVNLFGCESCESNDELLRYVGDIENVGVLTLAPRPLHNAGKDILFRLKGLAMLIVYVSDAGISHEMCAELKREMKLHNPDVEIASGDAEDNSEE